jgi:outer membrane protein OmpA-like peptidoglycan-associated protein
MRNRILKNVWMLAACLSTPAVAQQPDAERGEGTWEFSLGGGVKMMDRDFLNYLASGSASNRFTSGDDPGRLLPTAVVRLGYHFSRHFGFSLGAEGATGSGVRYLSPLAAVTYTGDLNATTSPFITVGSQITRVTGRNDRVTHPTWGAHLGVGVRSMVSENLALRLEGRAATEHYAEMPGGTAAYPVTATVGVSYFVGKRRPVVVASTPWRAQVDTIARVRVDTMRVTRVDTVRVFVRDSLPDQLVLRVQFRTSSAELLPKSRPVLDTIAGAMIATPDSRWEVQGHTDSIGSAAVNTSLAQSRAQTVVDYLVTKGVDRGSMTAVGFGPDRPAFSNGSVYGRAQNRRVQLRRVPPPPTGQPVP